ncbi:hypothetical protein HHK36_030234 [Tetracentron sinense]|uniref:Uncharacterized protein n=1 Tax=Tetracentron sinense TaxID=13715 RepID=A0A834YGZ7_TETSI|nr:hypothetical protein HHK36_030234 [Tetracentron sinense]
MAAIGNNNLNAKLVLLGDVGAGKSSLVLRFVKGQFIEFQESTIGAAFFSQTLAVNDQTVKFEIWDTAGQERYHSLAPMYYRGAAAAIIVYDITNTDSFVRAKKWVQELQKQGNPNMVMALAGNKADLEDKRMVTADVNSACSFWWILCLMKVPCGALERDRGVPGRESGGEKGPRPPRGGKRNGVKGRSKEGAGLAHCITVGREEDGCGGTRLKTLVEKLEAAAGGELRKAQTKELEQRQKSTQARSTQVPTNSKFNLFEFHMYGFW